MINKMWHLYFKLLFITLFLSIITKAQIPINDLGWNLQSSQSDEFSGTSINYNFWTVDDSLPSHGLEMMYRRNVKVSNGRLNIKVDTLLWTAPYAGATYTPFHYQSGHILSKGTYKYGYIEISAKFPVGNKLYWPAFWYWGGFCRELPGGSYQEIDINELGDVEDLDQHTMGTNFHVQDFDNYRNCVDHFHPVNLTGLPQLDQNFHKFALQWNPGGTYFYFDDSLVRSAPTHDDPITPYHALLTEIDIYVNPWVNPKPAFKSDSMVVDYLRYYTLNSNGCLSDNTICAPAIDYSTRGVYKTITAGGTLCTPTFNTSDKYTLRATDYVLLDVGTTINPNGSGQFSVIIEPCSN